MLLKGISLFRKSLCLSGAYSIAKFMDKNDNWSKIKQDEYKSYFQLHSTQITDKINSIISHLGNGQTNFQRISQNVEAFLLSN